MPNYTVKQGDCLSSIAQKYGLFWKKVYEHPKNADFRKKRPNPNIIYPGDVVFVPDKEEKKESGATGKRHRFRVKGVPAKLRLRLLIEDEPRANEEYTLEVDDKTFSGTTDADGRLEHFIPPNAEKGKLIVGENKDEYALNIGHLDPIDEISGIQARLNNLGFDCGKVDGINGPKTKAAMKCFQEKHGLTIDGIPGTQTQAKLREVYDS